MCELDKLDKTFASDLYVIYKRSSLARVYISDKDQLLMFYLSHKKISIEMVRPDMLNKYK